MQMIELEVLLSNATPSSAKHVCVQIVLYEELEQEFDTLTVKHCVFQHVNSGSVSWEL